MQMWTYFLERVTKPKNKNLKNVITCYNTLTTSAFVVLTGNRRGESSSIITFSSHIGKDDGYRQTFQSQGVIEEKVKEWDRIAEREHVATAAKPEHWSKTKNLKQTTASAAGTPRRKLQNGIENMLVDKKTTLAVCILFCAWGTMMPLSSHGRSASLKQREISLSVPQTLRQNQSSQRKRQTNFNESWIHQESCNEGCETWWRLRRLPSQV